MGWFCVEDDGNQVRKERHPLLVGHVPVTVAKQQEFKVRGRGAGRREALLPSGPPLRSPWTWRGLEPRPPLRVGPAGM